MIIYYSGQSCSEHRPEDVLRERANVMLSFMFQDKDHPEKKFMNIYNSRNTKMIVYYSGTLLVKGDNAEDVLRERANVMLTFGYSIGDWMSKRIKPIRNSRRQKQTGR